MPIIIVVLVFFVLMGAVIFEKETITVKACKELTCDCKCRDLNTAGENRKC